MIKVNLLPYREAQKREKGIQQLMLMGVAIVVAILLTVVLFLLQSTMHSNKEKEKLEVMEAISSLNKQLRKIESLEKDRSAVNNQKQAIEEIHERRRATVDLLYRMAGLVPDRIWIISYQEKDRDLLVDGYGSDPKDVSAFMENLMSSGLFDMVKLGSIDRSTIDKKDYVKFNLTLSKKATGGGKPKP